MRRPALTKAVIAGLNDIIPLIVGDYESMDGGWSDETIANVKRGIDYLEDLTYWHRQTARPPTQP